MNEMFSATCLDENPLIAELALYQMTARWIRRYLAGDLDLPDFAMLLLSGATLHHDRGYCREGGCGALLYSTVLLWAEYTSNDLTNGWPTEDAFRAQLQALLDEHTQG